ncbi:MAG: glycerol-3-phosphate 1-O-acyltransferase PlsY [Fuerstiella sp.]
MTFLLCCLAGFLIGGLPFGYLVGRVILHDDIRNHGSGNIGATNVARVIGWKWGGLVLLLDAVKGLLPTWAAAEIATSQLPDSQHIHLPVAVGICTIVGHMYPVYLKLRGGKGVATALGVVVLLAPQAVLIALGAFILVVATTKLVALASIAAAVSFGVAELWLLGESVREPKFAGMVAFAIGIPLLIIWRHRGNVGRILKGTEPKIGKRKPPEDQPPA